MDTKSLMKKYNKAMRSKKNRSDSDKKKIHNNFVSRLFFRIFLSSLILLTFVITDKITIQKTGKGFFTNVISKNWNFLKMTKTFNSLFGNFLPVNDEEVYSSNVYDKVIYQDGINYVTNNSFSGVTNLTSGVITKIKKEKNKTYTVTIQGSDDYLYTYSGLTSIDYRIYNYVNASDILGLASLNNGTYHFEVMIEKEGVKYDFYEKSED